MARRHPILKGLALLGVFILVVFAAVFFYAYLTGGDSKTLALFAGDGVGVLQIEGAIDDSRDVTTDDIQASIERLVPLSRSQREVVSNLRSYLSDGRAQSASFQQKVEAQEAFVPLELDQVKYRMAATRRSFRTCRTNAAPAK